MSPRCYDDTITTFPSMQNNEPARAPVAWGFIHCEFFPILEVPSSQPLKDELEGREGVPRC